MEITGESTRQRAVAPAMLIFGVELDGFVVIGHGAVQLPRGILPVPPEPEAAWFDFVEWCKGPPYQAAEPLLRKETYLKIFTEDKPYHAWELRQPEPETAP